MIAKLALVLAVVAGGGAGAAPEEKPFTYQGLIKQDSVGKLSKRTEPKAGGSTFAVGVIADAKEWHNFSVTAGVKTPAIDFDRYAVVYVILKENTNALRFQNWSVAGDGTGLLRFRWSLIQPYYSGRYPAVLYQVDRAGLKKVAVQFGDKPLAVVDVPAAKK
jgi:hypothetical protein